MWYTPTTPFSTFTLFRFMPLSLILMDGTFLSFCEATCLIVDYTAVLLCCVLSCCTHSTTKDVFHRNLFCKRHLAPCVFRMGFLHHEFRLT